MINWGNLAQRGDQLVLGLAGLLFCLGLAATSGNNLLAIVWLALAVTFLTMGVIQLLKQS